MTEAKNNGLLCRPIPNGKSFKNALVTLSQGCFVVLMSHSERRAKPVVEESSDSGGIFLRVVLSDVHIVISAKAGISLIQTL